MITLLHYEPSQDLRKLEIPVLVLLGGKDVQVAAEPNKKKLELALSKGKSQYNIIVFESANHLFQKAKTGLPSEYATLEKEFVKGFLPAISEWIKKTGD